MGPGFMVLCGLPLSGMGAIVNVSYNGPAEASPVVPCDHSSSDRRTRGAAPKTPWTDALIKVCDRRLCSGEDLHVFAIAPYAARPAESRGRILAGRWPQDAGWQWPWLSGGKKRDRLEKNATG